MRYINLRLTYLLYLNFWFAKALQLLNPNPFIHPTLAKSTFHLRRNQIKSQNFLATVTASVYKNARLVCLILRPAGSPIRIGSFVSKFIC